MSLDLDATWLFLKISVFNKFQLKYHEDVALLDIIGKVGSIHWQEKKFVY